MNPVDDTNLIRPLVKALRGHVDACAASLTDLPEERRHTVAATWVYLSAVVAWAESHYLIDPWLSAAVHPYMRRRIDASTQGMRGWLRQAVSSLAVHPSTQCLINPLWTAVHEGVPSEDACRDLADYWVTDAPRLTYDVTDGPASITGWIVGDLLQLVTDEQRKTNALVQTPWWIADFLIERTLIPAAAEHRDQPLPAIDPCCGTGHILTRMIGYLWQLHTTGELHPRHCHGMTPVTGWTPLDPAAAIERIVGEVTGVEIDPLTCAIARLRVLVAYGELMHRAGLLPVLRLDTTPHTIKPRIAVGDSLLPPEEVSWRDYADMRPRIAAIYGNPQHLVGQQDLRDLVAS